MGVLLRRIAVLGVFWLGISTGSMAWGSPEIADIISQNEDSVAVGCQGLEREERERRQNQKGEKSPKLSLWARSSKRVITSYSGAKFFVWQHIDSNFTLPLLRNSQLYTFSKNACGYLGQLQSNKILRVKRWSEKLLHVEWIDPKTKKWVLSSYDLSELKLLNHSVIHDILPGSSVSRSFGEDGVTYRWSAGSGVLASTSCSEDGICI